MTVYTFREALEDMASGYRNGEPGAFPELYCRPDTGGPRPGVLVTSGPTDYTDMERLHWSLAEYVERVRGRTALRHDNRHAHAGSTAEALAILLAWGYDPDARYWAIG